MDIKRILIVSATELEIKPLLKLSATSISRNHFQIEFSKNLILDILITGVGTHAMTYSLTGFLSRNNVAFVILAGISGSYTTSLNLGDTVNVQSERFADIGIIRANGFTDLFDMNLADSDVFPFENRTLNNYTLINNNVVNSLQTVKANTVNLIRPEVLDYIQKNTEIESMEGAAFFYVCLQEKAPFIQIRSISNYVGEQDKSKWEISLAVKNLNNVLLDILAELNF